MQVAPIELSSPVRILVVDDEEAIRTTLEGVFRDEGFDTLHAEHGNAALAMLEGQVPTLVFLDIWMPGMDGIETLRRIKERYPTLPVIMMSGHATIATAIRATKLGASDFIEKPLDLDGVLAAVHRALERQASQNGTAVSSVTQAPADAMKLPLADGSSGIKPLVFESQEMRGAAIPQRTLKRSAILYGQGLHSGKKSGLILEPLPANSGIHFVGVSEPTMVPAHVDYVESTGFATTVRLGQTQAGTIEHLMSALYAYGVSNLLIKCNGEVPVLDGSSRDFCSLFDEIGTEIQPGDWFEIKITETIRVGDDEKWIQIEPADNFSIDYTLIYPDPVGTQRMTFTLGDVESYKREIAPARTFGFVKDIGYLQKQGLALGGRFDNFVLFGGEDQPINDSLRFPDEPVRHKILDAIGDLYLLGRRIRGKVTAKMTGHTDNCRLLKEIRERMR